MSLREDLRMVRACAEYVALADLGESAIAANIAMAVAMEALDQVAATALAMEKVLRRVYGKCNSASCAAHVPRVDYNPCPNCREISLTLGMIGDELPRPDGAIP